MAETVTIPEALIQQFKFERLLNSDQAGRRNVLYGQISHQPALLILERAPFPTSPSYLSTLPTTLQSLQSLGANDIYYWFLASSSSSKSSSSTSTTEAKQFADLKLNLIYPCTPQHFKKYSKQGVRMVTETPSIYAEKIKPFIIQKREEGRLNWVYNVIEGKTEVEDVIYRTPLLFSASPDKENEEGFLLLPDLNWDRKTIENLHLLGVVERRDIWSLRDLKKKHVGWLRSMRERILRATREKYPEVEEDMLKLYVHYQPTYYHFHVHVVHVMLEAGGTQAVGKAVGLESLVEMLEVMEEGDVDRERGMESVTLCYTLGEESELWTDVFEPIKKRLGGASR